MYYATFQNCAAAIIAFIDSARSSVSVAVCWFTHPSIFQAVMHACARGLHVKILMNFDHINFHPGGLDFQSLEKAGATVSGYTGPGLLHYKFAVADESRVLTGSYNWTRAEQCDHLTIFQDNTLAGQFAAALVDISNHCHSLSELRNITPRQVSFSQLYRPTLWSVYDLRRRVVSGAKTWLVVAKTEQEWQRWITDQRHYLQARHGITAWNNRDVWDEQTFRNRLPSIRPITRQLLRRYCLQVQLEDVLVALTPTGRLMGAGIVGSGPEILNETPDLISRFVQWLVLKESCGLLDSKFPTLKTEITRHKGSALELISTLERNI